MKLKRDLHLEISRKLQNSVSVKVFAFRADKNGTNARVCLGALHMPEPYLRVFRHILEYGGTVLGARVTVGGSYFNTAPVARDDPLLTPAP